MSNPQKRKGPAFKPPRPVNNAAQPSKSTTATKRASGAAAARPAGNAKKAASTRPIFEPATLISSSESEGEDALSNSDRDEQMDDTSEPEARVNVAQTQMNPIPLPLLRMIVQEGFENEGTQISRGAMELTAKYMDIFVKEAIARARFERDDENKGGRGIMDGYLQVEDLERLAPQLILDF